MSSSRWKMMAGILVMSLGGLAAMAGQCPKSEPTKGSTPPEVPVASAPVLLPPVPMLEPTKPATIPPAPPVVQASGTLPVPPQLSLPMVPAIPTTPPAPASLPPAPPKAVPVEKPAPHPEGLLPPPAAEPGIPATPNFPDTDPLIKASTVTKLDPAPLATAVNAAAQAKYRILLRVGEGEPVFEVRSGDALLLKVVCEKVDVKSPEKGSGLSALKACGKVRFAGFGAEGTCDQLNFLAGTGEVAMSGNVKIQVKDKLGRVESELSAELMKYKIDPHEISGHGQLKP
jgi:hypothetical protein